MGKIVPEEWKKGLLVKIPEKMGILLNATTEEN
jgi:hypothetical protein